MKQNRTQQEILFMPGAPGLSEGGSKKFTAFTAVTCRN